MLTAEMRNTLSKLNSELKAYNRVTINSIYAETRYEITLDVIDIINAVLAGLTPVEPLRDYICEVMTIPELQDSILLAKFKRIHDCVANVNVAATARPNPGTTNLINDQMLDVLSQSQRELEIYIRENETSTASDINTKRKKIAELIFDMIQKVKLGLIPLESLRSELTKTRKSPNVVSSILSNKLGSIDMRIAEAEATAPVITTASQGAPDKEAAISNLSSASASASATIPAASVLAEAGSTHFFRPDPTIIQKLSRMVKNLDEYLKQMHQLATPDKQTNIEIATDVKNTLEAYLNDPGNLDLLKEKLTTALKTAKKGTVLQSYSLQISRLIRCAAPSLPAAAACAS